MTPSPPRPLREVIERGLYRFGVAIALIALLAGWVVSLDAIFRTPYIIERVGFSGSSIVEETHFTYFDKRPEGAIRWMALQGTVSMLMLLALFWLWQWRRVALTIMWVASALLLFIAAATDPLTGGLLYVPAAWLLVASALLVAAGVVANQTR